jgi:hypothetical protein
MYCYCVNILNVPSVIYSLLAFKIFDILISNTDFNYIRIGLQEVGWG